MHADKSEAIILGTAPPLRSAATVRAVKVAGSRLQVALKLKSLGVTIDSRSATAVRLPCQSSWKTPGILC